MYSFVRCALNFWSDTSTSSVNRAAQPSVLGGNVGASGTCVLLPFAQHYNQILRVLDSAAAPDMDEEPPDTSASPDGMQVVESDAVSEFQGATGITE